MSFESSSVKKAFAISKSKISIRKPSKAGAALSLALQFSILLSPFFNSPAFALPSSSDPVTSAGAINQAANAGQSDANEASVRYANDLVSRATSLASQFREQAAVYKSSVASLQTVPPANAAAAVATPVNEAALTANSATAQAWAAELGALATNCEVAAQSLTVKASDLQKDAAAVASSIGALKAVAQTCDTGTEIAAAASTVVAIGVASQLSGNPYAQGASASGTQLGVGIAGGVAGAMINSQLGATKSAAVNSNSTATVAAAGICGSFLVDGYEGISYFATAKTVSQDLKTDQALLSSLQSSNGDGNSGGAAFVATIASGLPTAVDPSPGALSVTQQGQVKKAVSTLQYVEPITYIEAGGYTGLAAYCGFQCLSLYGGSMLNQNSDLLQHRGILEDELKRVSATVANYNLILSPPKGNLDTSTMGSCPPVTSLMLSGQIQALKTPVIQPQTQPVPPPADAVASSEKNTAANVADLSSFSGSCLQVPASGGIFDQINISQATAYSFNSNRCFGSHFSMSSDTITQSVLPPVKTSAATDPGCVAGHVSSCYSVYDTILTTGSNCSPRTLAIMNAAGCGVINCSPGQAENATHEPDFGAAAWCNKVGQASTGS